MAFKMKGFSPFTKKDDKKEYEPQTKTVGYKGGRHTDMMPQTQRDKASITRLEGEIEGILDNEYMEAKDRGDKSAIKRYERRMLNLKKSIEDKGGKYTHVDMSNFGKSNKKKNKKESIYGSEGGYGR